VVCRVCDLMSQVKSSTTRTCRHREVPVGYTPVPLFSESGAHFLRPTSRTCSTGELSGAATGQEVLLARAVAVETAEEAAVDARRSFLKRASEGTRRPSLALPLVSEVIL
jgi:hypothetical protein